MGCDFDKNYPVYLQLADDLKYRIIRKEYELGAQLPTVRDLAIKYGVNPNTAQRALSELEKEGFCLSVRTTGRFVTENEDIVKTYKENLANQIFNDFISKLNNLGYQGESLEALLKKYFSEDQMTK